MKLITLCVCRSDSSFTDLCTRNPDSLMNDSEGVGNAALPTGGLLEQSQILTSVLKNIVYVTVKILYDIWGNIYLGYKYKSSLSS